MVKGCCSPAASQAALASIQLDNACIPSSRWDGSIHPTILVKSSSSAWEEDSLVLTTPKERCHGLGKVSG